MHSTGIEYSTTERTSTVLPEMAQLLPPLTEEQLSALEADLLANGCYSPIIVNENLDHSELSINQGYNLTRQLQEVPEEARDETTAQLVELTKAKKEVRQLDAEAEHRGEDCGAVLQSL